MRIIDKYRKGILTELIRRVNDEIGKAIEYKKTIENQSQIRHYDQFISTLRYFTEWMPQLEPDAYIQAFSVMLLTAYKSKLIYRVTAVEMKVEYECGVAEAVRFGIQSLVNICEYAHLYSCSGAAIRLPNTDDKEFYDVVKAFYQSPFSYDNVFSQYSAMNLILDGRAIKFPTKDRSNLEIGDVVPWE